MKILLGGIFIVAVIVSIVSFVLVTLYFTPDKPDNCCQLLEAKILAMGQEINFQSEQIKRMDGRHDVLTQRITELSSRTKELEKRLPIKWKAK